VREKDQSLSIVGTSVRRVDGVHKVTGATKFAGDLNSPAVKRKRPSCF